MFTLNTKKLNLKMAILVGNLALALFAVILFICNCYPFGDNTFLMFDMKRQYVDYYSYVSSIYHGNNNPFYSFATALGSGTYGFFAYYLTSPFLLLLSAFPSHLLPLGVEIVIALKLSLATFIMNLFLQRFFDVDYVTILCALSWSFSSFVFAHSMNMMWIDVVIMLPIVIWTFERFITNDKFAINGAKDIFLVNVPYIVSIFAILFLNYYLSYQVLLFVALWALMRIFSLQIPKKGYKIIQIFFNTIIGALLDAVFLIPTALELVNSPKDITRLGLELTGRNLSPFEVFSKIGTLSYDIEEPRFGGPQIFCGVLFAVLTVMFFVNRKIAKKEKIGIGILFGILMLSFCIDLFNLIWHAGMEPSGHPYRQAFIWIFLCILCSCRMIMDIKESMDSDINSRPAYKFIGIGVGVVAIIYLLSLSKRYDHVSNATIIVSWALLLTVGLMMMAAVRFKSGRILIIVSALIGIIQLADITANAVYTYNFQSVNNTKMSEYSGIISSTSKTFDFIKDHDKTFYRMENLTPRQQNDAMQYGYNGVTHYSSAGMTYVRDFLQSLGYNDDTLYTQYGADNTSLADSILGIRYLVSDGEVIVHPNYSKINSGTSELVLENMYALPVAIGVNDYGIPTVDEICELNPFKLQEDIVSRLTEEKRDVFVNASVSEEEFSENGNLCREYSVVPAITGELYFYIEGISDYVQGLVIEVNDEYRCGYGNNASMKIINIGSYKAGQTVKVKVIGDSADAKLGEAIFVSEDVRAIEDTYHKLKSMFTNVTRESSSHIKITAPNCNGVFMTVPYEKGWEITVDGINTNPQMVYGALMYIPINSVADTHYIDMKFVPEGFNLGLIISIIVLGVVVLLVLKDVKVSDEKELS